MATAKQANRPAEPKTAPQRPPPAAANAANMVQELKVSGHLMALPAGLFCIVNEPHPGSQQNGGFPGVRISPPPAGQNNVEISSFRPDGWLSATGDAALVRIHKGPAQVLVTIYQLPNQPDSAPKLQVRQLSSTMEAPPAAPEAPVRADIMAHIQTRGDVGAKFGEWLGERGSQNWIEGFAIAAPEGLTPASLSYQGVLGRGWLSPWVEAGQYCGSRGMALPLLGLRVRLEGEAAAQYDLTVAASFIDGTSSGPVAQDETCESASLAPLEAILVTLTPRTRKPSKVRR